MVRDEEDRVTDMREAVERYIAAREANDKAQEAWAEVWGSGPTIDTLDMDAHRNASENAARTAMDLATAWFTLRTAALEAQEDVDVARLERHANRFFCLGMALGFVLACLVGVLAGVLS